ncbi:MAG: type VI secretion system protein TssA [Glaciimonas sp.]|nr:type VI secretion system protein TssA [Glaciimonas sp.]
MPAVSQQLNPINDSEPCGNDLSFSADLDAIAEARRFDDPTLDQGEWVTALKEADWNFVVQHCASLLTLKSKDLRLAVWFAEASAKTKKFRGLGDGYSLISGLCDNFWENLHPLAEDGDQERKIGNLSWMLACSVQLIHEMPITEGKGTSFSSIDFESARTRAAHAEKIVAEGGTPEVGLKLTTIEAARRKSSRGFYDELLVDSHYCLAALLQMEKSVDVRLGVDGPGFSAAKEALDNVIMTIERFAADAGIKTQNAELLPTDLGQGHAPAHTAFNGPIQTRAQALAQLRAVAEFFRRAEPHSPVAYLADKAANWGDLPLHTWLRAVIKDSASLAHVEELLGLQIPGSDDH